MRKGLAWVAQGLAIWKRFALTIAVSIAFTVGVAVEYGLVVAIWMLSSALTLVLARVAISAAGTSTRILALVSCCFLLAMIAVFAHWGISLLLLLLIGVVVVAALVLQLLH